MNLAVVDSRESRNIFEELLSAAPSDLNRYFTAYATAKYGIVLNKTGDKTRACGERLRLLSLVEALSDELSDEFEDVLESELPESACKRR